MSSARNTTALVAVFATSLTWMGQAMAQDDAVSALVSCVTQGDGGTCPTGLDDAQIDAAIAIIADRTGMPAGQARQAVRERLDMAGADQAPAAEEVAAEPDVSAPADAAAQTEAEGAAQGEPASAEAGAPAEPVLDEAEDLAEDAADVPAEATPEEVDSVPEDTAEGTATEPDDEAADAARDTADEATVSPDTATEAATETASDPVEEVVEEADTAVEEVAEPADNTADTVASESPRPIARDDAGSDAAQTGASPETEAEAARPANETGDETGDDDLVSEPATSEQPEATEEAASTTEAPSPTVPGPDATNAEIVAALSDMPEGPERDALLARLADRLSEDAEAAQSAEAVAEDAAAEQTADAAREETLADAEETARQALDSDALAAVDGDGGTDEVTETETEMVTEETSRSSGEESGRIETQTADTRESDTDNSLRNILGAAAAGFVIGQLLDNGGEVVARSDDRVVVDRNGELIVLRDENTLLRRPGTQVFTDNFADGSSRTVFVREDGTEVVTVRAPDGSILYRARLRPDGTRVVLIDERQTAERPLRLADLPQPSRTPVIDYTETATSQELALALRQAERADTLDRSFSLRQVRENRELRELMPRVDLDAITFDTGSAAITPDQAQELSALGRAMAGLIEESPDEVFLIEGHTDTVGSAVLNLALSDRRAESVALALTEYFGIPPENMITQGYGERFLKYPIEGDIRENRRAAVRRITPLIRVAQQ